jgi:hypothetical protein
MDIINCVEESHIIQDGLDSTAECQAQLLTLLASSDGMPKTICRTFKHRDGTNDIQIAYYRGSKLCRFNSKGGANQQCTLTMWKDNALSLFNSCVSNHQPAY